MIERLNALVAEWRKYAREQPDRCAPDGYYAGHEQCARDLEEALAAIPKQKPAAWRVRPVGDRTWSLTKTRKAAEAWGEFEPLYAGIPARPEAEINDGRVEGQRMTDDQVERVVNPDYPGGSA